MGKTALITGASAGLGAEFARQLGARGMNLVLIARRLERLQVLAQELESKHAIRVHNVAADLSDPAALDTIEAAVQGLQIDWLINNAGSAGPELLDAQEWEIHRRYLELMLTSAAALCHLLIPPMQERGYGRVINVSSVAGRVARPAGGHYGPIKAWMVAMSEELNLSLRGSGVHVSALCPGFTHTEFHAAGDLQEMKDALPGFIWYDAATVVREGIEGVEAGKGVRVSGRLYRWLDPMLRSPLLGPVIAAIRR